MSNFIKHVHIKNFKSIKSANIRGCKRINLLIGRPNAGRSNILEALSVFSIPFLKENKSKSIANLIRLENETELFYSGNIDETIAIETNVGSATLSYNKNEGIEIGIDTVTGKGDYTIDERLNLKTKKSGDYIIQPSRNIHFLLKRSLKELIQDS